MITTQIEIAAAPAEVREAMLDFRNISSWHSGLIKSITPLETSDQPLAVGNKLHCETEGFAFDSVITKNDETAFEWQGPPVFGVVAGLHTFRFEPSKTTPGGTTFFQTEEYSGVGKFLMSQALLGGGIKKQFEKFNADLKAKAE